MQKKSKIQKTQKFREKRLKFLCMYQFLKIFHINNSLLFAYTYFASAYFTYAHPGASLIVH